MSAPVLSWLLAAQRKPRSIPNSAILAMHESTIHRKASSTFCSAQTSEQGPLHPAPRANPFPEVTDLFCRLPLPTFFYGLEAANLGDLMRLWVRPGVRINLSFGFSRAVESAPDTSNVKVLYPPCNPISKQFDFRVTGSLKEKTTLPKAPSYVTEFYDVAIQYPCPDWGRLAPPPVESKSKACVCRTPLSLRLD